MVDIRQFPKYIAVVKTYVIEDYDSSDVRLPCGVCATHKNYINILHKKFETGDEVQFTPTIDLSQLALFLKETGKLSRRADNCSCLICAVAKAPGLMVNVILKKAHDPTIGEESKPNPPIRLCGNCLHPIYRGSRGHICNETNLLENISNFVPEKVQEKFAARVLKRKLGEGDEENVSLPTGGKAFKLKVDKSGDKEMRQFQYLCTSVAPN